MKFSETELPGAFVIELEPHADERGFFARSFCEREFVARGLEPRVAQCNVSYNRRRSTLRGMHYQQAPHQEAKLVRCTAGAIFDAIVDLRRDSPSYLRWTAVELSAEDRSMLYVPPGLAHGFLTLRDATEVFYQMSQFHAPEAARGFRFDDPRFAIAWPEAPALIAEKDQALPLFDPDAAGPEGRADPVTEPG